MPIAECRIPNSDRNSETSDRQSALPNKKCSRPPPSLSRRAPVFLQRCRRKPSAEVISGPRRIPHDVLKALVPSRSFFVDPKKRIWLLVVDDFLPFPQNFFAFFRIKFQSRCLDQAIGL